MKKKNHWVSWKKAVAIVALTAPAIVGVGGAANAAVATPVTLSSQHSVVNQVGEKLTPRVATAGGAASGSTTPISPRAESRSLFSALIKAIQAVPGLWAKFSAAVKKAYSAFVSVWNAIKGILGAIGTLISAWDIWQHFH